jgi:pimeloyl-ACP methyl ester carboxylesterase/ubiquinone/menaquinone biosynthesis C-methylase UbiE
LNRLCGYHHAVGLLKNEPFASLRALPLSPPRRVQFGRRNSSGSGNGSGNGACGVRDLVYCHRSFGTSSVTSTNGNVLEKVVSAPNGIDFRVTIRNPDAPHPVLCLPGALGTGSSDFENLLHDDSGGLGSEFGIYAFDPRGLGGSVNYSRNHNSKHESSDHLEVVPRDYPIDFYIRDALDASQVMKALGFDRFSVLGWSDGANSAVHLASHPDTKEYVRNLVIWGGGAYVTNDDVDAWESLRDIQKWSPRVREEKGAIHGGLERLQQLNHAATDGWIQLYLNPMTNGDVCLSALHQVDCPTSVLHGGKDVICETKHAQYIARQIPDATLTIFPDGKHNIHQRYATEFHQLVRNFLIETMGEVDHSLDSSGSNDNKSDGNEQPAIDDIAYGFMGSKALSVALKIGLFDAIDIITKEHGGSEKNTDLEGAATLDQILARCEEVVPEERLRTLLSACVALKLINRRVLRGRDVYSLPKASTQQLTRSSNRYWGDYIVGQVDAQFYTRMKDLDKTIIKGDSSSDGYEAWFEKDPEAAKMYTQAQHNGSLATGFGLLKRLPELSGGERYPKLRMLDVGGGSGAFSIATARKVKDASCVVLDLPNVAKVAKEIISKEDEQVQNRLSTLSLSATAPDQWTGIVEDESFDVVLMSYVSGSIPAEALSGLYRNAYRALKPGGIAVIHDFFVDNNGEGPKNAALWALTHVTVNPEGMGLRPGRVTKLLLDEGFVSPKVDDMIPETTQLVVATKPGI